MGTTIPKPEHGSKEWLLARWKDEEGNLLVSASDAAAIYDLHPFKSREQYAAEQLSKQAPEPKAPSEAMERGNRLEAPLLEWVSDRIGKKITTPDVMYRDGRMSATLDGMTEDGDIVEIKTYNKQWTGTLPAHWAVQGVQQAICAGKNKVIWGVFDSTLSLHIYEQTVSSDEMAEHKAAVRMWFEAIDYDATPTGVRWSYATITSRYNAADGSSVEVGPWGKEVLDQLRHVKSELKSYEQMEDMLKAEFCELMGNSESATIDGNVVATWKPQVRSSFDSKAFKADNPELTSQYTKQMTIRTFNIKGAK
jgi:putative phage-type endonuclease